MICPACHDRDAASPLAVCRDCRDEARRCLRELRTWFDAMLLPPVKAKGRAGKGHAQPVPVNDRVTEVRHDVVATLASWVGAHNDTASTSPVHQTLIDRIHAGLGLEPLIRYLSAAEDWLLASDGAADYVHELQRVAHAAQRTAAPARREGVVIAVHVAGDCDEGNVWARNLSDLGRCAGCGRTEPVDWWHAQYPPSPDDLFNDVEAADYIVVLGGDQVSVKTIAVLRFRGALPAAPHKKRGRVATSRATVEAFVSARWTERLAC